MRITRKTRRILCVLLCLCLALSGMAVATFAAADTACENGECSGIYENGFCTEGSSHYEAAVLNGQGIYEISNGGQLYWFAKFVDSGNTSANAVLTGDITVNQNVLLDGELNEDLADDFRSWNPIGSNSKKYIGTFDGAGFTVSGLYYDNTSTLGSYVGLAATLGEGGNIKNVNIADSFIQASRSAGAIAGSNAGGSIDNCASSAVIIAEGSNVGGIVGNNISGAVTNSANSGTVSGENENIGGIAGGNAGTIAYCHNTGAVACTQSGTDGYVGGIAGYNDNNTVISDCYNTGKVSNKNAYSGGIAGYDDGGTIKNCYNTGSVGGKADIGAITGGVDRAPAIVNCYYLADSAVYAKGIHKTADQFASGEVASLLQAAQAAPEGETDAPQVWYQNIDVKDAAPDVAPVLDHTHGIVYYGYINCTETGYTNNADYETPSNHAYGEPAFRWSEEGTAAEAVFTCTVCEEDTEGHTLTVAAKVEAKESTAENCQETGTTVYTATVELNGETYTDSKSVEGAKGLHVDTDSDNACDLCGESMGKPTDPKPGDPDDTDPKPSEPEEDEPKYELPECPKDATCVLSQFSDVKIDDWYHDGVHFCVVHGIVNGMGNGTFAPNDPTTRAQLVTMLYRLEGEPSIDGMSEPFTDVSENDWFYAPIVWAYNNKVVNGMTETTFAPDAKITREQVATILHRYLGTPAGSGDLSGYPDADKVQDYAKDALTWAVGEGLINGVAQTDGTSLLAPDGNATRAQIATILMRYLTGK